MAKQMRILASLLFVVAACGDDDGGNNNGNDGGTPDGTNFTCAQATKQITAYPGMTDGTVVGGGADLNVAEGACTDTVEDEYYEPLGEDVVVALSNLTVGQKYGVTLEADADLSMYLTKDCPPAMGEVTNCSLFSDLGFRPGDGETASFTATAPEQYLVVDTASEKALEEGAFSLRVKAATCSADAECTVAGNPYCVDFDCHQCVSSFDCTAAATPTCDATATCVAGPMQCTGDDASDTAGNGDDGPAVATMLATPTAGTPTVVTGHSVCNVTAAESDWYKVTLAANVGVSLEFTGAANDLDVYVVDADGAVVASGVENAGINEEVLTEGITASGTYYIIVSQYLPNANTVAVPYTLTVGVPECDPAAFRSCTTAAAPVCTAAGKCGAGPALCAADTAGEPNDDGPAGGRNLVTGVATAGAICTSPASEFDYYTFVATPGAGETISLAWTGATVDLDMYITDATGKLYGESFYKNPEVVTLTNLPAGTYYVRVENYLAQGGTASTTSTAYTITGTATANVGCTNANSCATTYNTQIFRGACAPVTGVCSFIPAGAGAANTLCDSNDDCTSTKCSYLPFESDAGKSVCTPASCANDAACTAIGADLRCTTGFATNFCTASCTADVNCGAIVSSATLDAGQPWNYRTCTVATGACTAN